MEEQVENLVRKWYIDPEKAGSASAWFVAPNFNRVIDLKLEQSHRLNMLKVMNVHFKFHEVFPNTQGSAMQDPSSNSHKPSCLDTRDWGAVILSLARHRRQVTRPTAVASNISTP
ncbi:hypothetical protein sscle_13g092320 [Sclerotinia sclerotiorum 1980 UF-70]|uniref:Uncharacterized protein n=1 Tax=Sclerotinia sclerotiorum (strain ATCC 18683 / 1980 / Ss-1) TaxID=665079 RepID=A0A1D9QI36_SCLS1|nr:hypothetical protein sscle_13g092320 [Sclerotinia sclerotiorum 1980 UF-70]